MPKHSKKRHRRSRSRSRSRSRESRWLQTRLTEMQAQLDALQEGKEGQDNTDGGFSAVSAGGLRESPCNQSPQLTDINIETADGELDLVHSK